MSHKLTHIDTDGRAHMVDVADKADTKRMAKACGLITLSPATLAAIAEGRTKKGDVLSVAELAGIMGAKKNIRAHSALSSATTFTRQTGVDTAR